MPTVVTKEFETLLRLHLKHLYQYMQFLIIGNFGNFVTWSTNGQDNWSSLSLRRQMLSVV